MSHFIEWRHDGRRLILPVIILAPEPSTDLTGVDALALVDTGSTTSGVTPRIARSLRLSPRGKRPLGSAQGEGQAERYLFRVGIEPPSDAPIFPYVFEGVSGFELSDSFQFDALIGMDILRHCDLELRRDGYCRLCFGN
jgi:hypothetical protein